MVGYDFINVVFATKDELFSAVRKAMFRNNERYHDDSRYLIKEEYRSMMNTIKHEIPDNAINCCLEIEQDWFEDQFVYSLSYDIPEEQQYYPEYQGIRTQYYTNYNKDLWDDLEDL